MLFAVWHTVGGMANIGSFVAGFPWTSQASAGTTHPRLARAAQNVRNGSAPPPFSLLKTKGVEGHSLQFACGLPGLTDSLAYVKAIEPQKRQ